MVGQLMPLEDITNFCDAQASLGTLTDASAVMVAHRLLWSAMHINDDDDWPVNSVILSSMIYAVFLCDDYHLLFPVV